MEDTIETMEEEVNKGSWRNAFINTKTSVCLALVATALAAGVSLEGDYLITSRSLNSLERDASREKACEMALSYQKKDNPFMRMITAGGRKAAKEYFNGRCE